MEERTAAPESPMPVSAVTAIEVEPVGAGVVTVGVGVAVAVAVRELKAKPGGELQVHGSGALFRWLLDNALVDEITLFTFPVVVGRGTRLFSDVGPNIALDLVKSRVSPSGVTIQVYRLPGRSR